MARVKMKANDFYNRLSKCLEKGFKIAEDTIKHSDSNIRLSCDHRSFCPITAVAYSETGKYFNTDDYQRANRLLGLHYDVVKSIVGGADGDYDKTKTRIKLKKALGLPTA